MKYFILSILLLSSLYASESLSSWFKDGNVSGNIKYYYIETNKNYITGVQTSTHSNAIGGQLHYETSRLKNFALGTTFMTTQGFLLPNNVESSTLGQDEGKKGGVAKDSYSVLGEVYGDYKNKYINVWYGRRIISTPMIGPKKSRMLPSTVEGGEVKFFVNNNIALSLIYADKFKQRTAKNFSNIIEHALGSDTYSITGKNGGDIFTASLKYKNENILFNFYNMYAQDFINSAYFDLAYKKELYSISTQFVSQRSIGNADTNLAKITSVTNGKKINSNAFGIRGGLNYKESSFDLVYRNVLRDASSYDSIITPWDGELLYAYSSTTNNLGQSLYGNGLTAGGAYVGGTQGVKLGYTQKYLFAGLKGWKTHLAYARYRNSLYREDQQDLKAILFYDIGNISIQLKGIWIDNDTYTFKNGTVNQLDSLTQYHAIVNYKF